jgi:hypothetical protein
MRWCFMRLVAPQDGDRDVAVLDEAASVQSAVEPITQSGCQFASVTFGTVP